MRSDGRQRMASLVEKRTKEGHTYGAERNQPVFDLAAGEISRAQAAHANSNRQSGLQVGRVRIVDTQNIVAIDHEHSLEKDGEEEEICVTQDGPSENTVRPNDFQLVPKIADRVHAKAFRGIRRRHARDSEARYY